MEHENLQIEKQLFENGKRTMENSIKHLWLKKAAILDLVMNSFLFFGACYKAIVFAEGYGMQSLTVKVELIVPLLFFFCTFTFCDLVQIFAKGTHNWISVTAGYAKFSICLKLFIAIILLILMPFVDVKWMLSECIKNWIRF